MPLDFSSRSSLVKDEELDFSSKATLDFSSKATLEEPAPKEEPSFFDRAKGAAGAVADFFSPPEFKSVLEDRMAPVADAATTSRVPLRPEVRKEFNAAFDAATPVERQKASDQKGWRGQVARERTDKWAASDAAVPTKTVRELDTRKEYQAFTPSKAELKPKTERMQLEEVAEQSRSAMDYGKDFYNALGQGIVTVPKLAVDLVAPDSALAGRLRTELASMRDQESETIQARDALMQMSIKEKEGFVDKYVETASQLLGNPSLGIRELVRQLPMMAGIAAASAAGGGLAVGAAGVAGRLSPAVALSNALTSGGITAAAKAAGAAAGGIGGSMTMAGGDAAGSTYEHYMDDKAMTQAMLDKSPEYQDLMRSGLSPQDARRELAVTKSRMAALMAAPLGLLGFMGAEAAIVARVVRGAAPKKFGAKEAAGLVLRDSIGEQLEEGGTQAASNFAIQTVDENRSLMEGVPQAMATAAVTSAPMSVGAAALNMTGRQTPTPPPIDPTPDAGQMMRGLLGGAVPPETAEQATQRAMNDIGTAGSVDDAIGAAQAAVRTSTRAVTLDDAALLAGGLDQAGIAAEELTQRAMPQGVDAAIGEASAAVGQTPETTTWTGRRGDGYATIEDATRAMTERSKTRPAFDWTAQQNADGRFVLQGVKRGTAQPEIKDVPGTSLLSNYPTQQAAEAALVASGSPAGSAQVQARGDGFTIAPTQPKESIRELRNQADQVDALAGAIAAQGEDASNIQLYTAEPRDDVYSEEVGGRSVRPPRPGVAGAADTVAEIGRITQVAFGWKPIPVTGLGETYGVQYKGSVFVDVAELAAGNTYGSSVEAMAIQTIGHETTHNLEKSQDPQDQADYALLRDAILSNAKGGVVDRRVAAENKGQTYGENEIVADVSGDFWLDPKFWNRLYDLDSAAMRRIAYKFMEGATKLIEVVKGSRLDAGRFINNVDAVREVAAQVWASKAKRGDSLFAGENTGTVSRSESTIETNDGPAKQPVSAERDSRGSRPEDRAASGRQNAAEQPRQAGANSEGNAAAPRGKDGRLDGAPSVPGFSGPDPRIVSVAEQYARDNGIALKPQSEYAKIDPARAKRIADAYTDMMPAPNDPEVKAAYQNLIDQTVAQYRALEDAGYKFWFIDINTQAGQDYVSTPWNAMRDMRANQSMGVFPSEEGFGSSDLDVSSNPLLAETDVMWPAGSPDGPMQRVLANDLFRAVHDAFGHGMEGAGFRAEGEENAWQAHVRLFTGSAVAAITSETRGQNSFVNFGPNAEANQTAQAIDTVFADQKVGLMPEWTWTEGRVGDEVASTPTTKEDDERSRSSESARSTEGPNRVRDGSGRPNEASRSRSGVELAANGGQDRPSYGQARDGATSAVGFHYSKQARTNLVSAFYGTGLKGLEAKRLEGQRDITPRIYFYVDKGRGVNPEAGVGGVAHSVILGNLYDVSKDSLGIVSGTRGMEGDRQNNWERAVMQAGFDGYLVVDDILPQNYAVLVGKHTVPVAQANPTRGDGKVNVMPAEKKSEQTRTAGKELVRRPQGPEVMQVIAAMRAGIEQVAPSFKMEFGEARVLASEAAIADTVLADQPGGFAFGEVASRSDAFAEFDDTPDNALSGMEVIEQAIYTPPEGFADIESMADILRAELAKDQALSPNLTGQVPTAQAIKDAGIHPEDAFDMTGALGVYSDDSADFQIPDYARSVMRNTIIRGKSGSLLVSVASRRHSTFVETPGLSDAQVEKYAARQIAGAILTDQGHDIADAQSKGMVLKIAATWKKVASKAGAFKLPAAKTKSTDFATVAQQMDAFKDYDVDAQITRGAGFILFTRKSDSKQFNASVSNRSDGMEVCTMGLANSGGLGTELYAVLGRVAENMGAAFNADSLISGVNAYRRTEQAMSYALKSGRTDVLLPGAQNRVYGFDKAASTQEAHDRNIARLALAGLRNVEELMPDVRRLKYLPKSDLFVDAQGVDAEAAVTKALADPQARVFGLGRSTIARAVITGQIIAGESIEVDSFQSPIAYSLANAEMDSPMGEAWGDANDLNPSLERFIAGSQIVDKDGKPKMMFHGTAQDIKAFRPKQAGAVFLTDDPDFAETFADRSETWMMENWQEVLTPEQQATAKAQAIAAVMADKLMSTTERKRVKQQIKRDDFSDPDVSYRMLVEVSSMMPSKANILPVFVRATAPFDYREKADVDSVVFGLWDKAGMDDGDTLEITPVKVGGDSDFYSQRKLHSLISDGNWDIIESPEVQAIIKDTLGHDGFWVKESGQRNLAVYDPKMVKSVFNSTYDTSTDDISRSRENAESPQGSSIEDRTQVLREAIATRGGVVQDTMQVDEFVDSKEIKIIGLKDLVGMKIFPTIADRTAAAALYRGIDSSSLEVAIPLLGGPYFPLRRNNWEAGVVWANRGSAVTSQKAAKLKEGADHMLIVMGSSDMHMSNSTVAAALMGTLGAHQRDGRISDVQLAGLSKLVTDVGDKGIASFDKKLKLAEAALDKATNDADKKRASKDISGAKKEIALNRSLKNFPGFQDPKAMHDYMDTMTFDGRKRVIELVASKAAQALGAPPMSRILDATREPSLAGHRWGDGVLLVKIDQEGPQVVLGQDGTTAHPDFPLGIKGKVVGKLSAAINWTVLWQDWIAAQTGESPRRAFELSKPVLDVTQELVDRIGPIDQGGISSARQARLAADFAADNWRDSSKDVKQGGTSPQAFVDALQASEAKDTLTQYSVKEVTAGIKTGAMKLYQLGDGQIFFMLQREGGKVSLASVVNNEAGARGIGGPAVILKAIEQGATNLDAYAVKSDQFPYGFLPSLYAAFGFKKVGQEMAFDPQYLNGLQARDAVKFWQKTTKGFDPEKGMPGVVEMQWSGTDDERSRIRASYLRSGFKGLLAGGTRPNAEASWSQFSDPDLAQAGGRLDTATDDSGVAGDQGAAAGASVASGAYRTVQALARLNDGELNNLGLTRADADAALRATGPEIASRSRVGNQFTLEDETYVQQKRRKLQDYFLRVQTVQRAVMGQGGTVTEQTDVYGAEVLSHGRKNALLQDFARDTVAPLMTKLVKQGIEMNELSLYAYAKHAEERNKRIASIDRRTPDGGSGMKTADANTILAAVAASGNQAKYDDLHSDLMAIVQANRLVMLDEGLITQDEFNALDGMYQNYIPLRGFEVVDEENKPTGRSAGQGFNVRGAETVRALGRKTRAGQLMENVFGDYQRTTVRVEHNHVAKVFLNFVLQNPDTKLWEIDATTTRKALDRQTGRIARNTAIEKGEDTIAVKVKGREVYIQIKDPLLARAMRKSHTDETGELARDLMRSVGLYTTLLRNTLTRYNPEFAVVNSVRDFGFGMTATLDVLGEKGAAKFAAHYAGAVLVSARNEHNTLDPNARAWDKWFTEYRAAGGITGGFYQRNVEDITEDIRGLMLEAGAAPKDLTERLRHNAVTRMVAKAGRVLEYAGSVSENAARVSAYRTAREMGKTPSQAAIIAKNLTTNFDRKGEYGQMLNSLYVFFNAAVQGTHRTVQLFKNPKVLSYMGLVTSGTFGLALANAVAGGDDPDDGMAYWDKIPPFVKERNIIIMLPPDSQVEGAETVGTKGRYLMIPVQYGLNIFPVIGYGIADYIRNQQDASRGATAGQVGIRYTSAFLGSFNPFGGMVDVTSGSSMAQAVMPSIFDPVVQFTTGTNAFGRDSAPFKSPFDAKPDSQNSNVRQSGGPAERVAQWMNESTGGSEYESGAIDVSAGSLENVVRALTGGTGIFLYDTLALADKSLERAAGGDPDLFVRDIPVYRRIMGETAGDIDQGLFYERRKQIQEARSVEKGANEAGVDITDPKKLALASLSKDAGQYTKWLAEIRREMKDVQTDTEMTKGDRKLKLRELRAERDRLTADFNRDFTDVMREELNAE